MPTEQQIDALAEWLWGHFGNRGMPRQWTDFSADQRAFWRLLAKQASEVLSPRLQVVPAVSQEDIATCRSAMQRVIEQAEPYRELRHVTERVGAEVVK